MCPSAELGPESGPTDPVRHRSQSSIAKVFESAANFSLVAEGLQIVAVTPPCHISMYSTWSSVKPQASTPIPFKDSRGQSYGLHRRGDVVLPYLRSSVPNIQTPFTYVGPDGLPPRFRLDDRKWEERAATRHMRLRLRHGGRRQQGERTETGDGDGRRNRESEARDQRWSAGMNRTGNDASTATREADRAVDVTRPTERSGTPSPSGKLAQAISADPCLVSAVIMPTAVAPDNQDGQTGQAHRYGIPWTRSWSR